MFFARKLPIHKSRYFIKVKSDRINALRKQYDAFLEEDKKRKERNEYILGRLDTMRYSQAVVPMRHKPPTVYKHSAASYNQFSTYPDTSTLVNATVPNISLHMNEDSNFIREISKKYILIPKRSSYPEHQQNIPFKHDLDAAQVTASVHNLNLSDTTSATAENPDWKSKYEILNILKKDEKENNFTETYATNRLHNKDTDHPLQEYFDEIPEKDVAVEQHNQDQNNTNNFRSNEISNDPLKLNAPVEPTNTNYNGDILSTHVSNNINAEINYSHQELITQKDDNEMELNANIQSDSMPVKVAEAADINKMKNISYSETKNDSTVGNEYTFVGQNNQDPYDNVSHDNVEVNPPETNLVGGYVNDDAGTDYSNNQINQLDERNVQELATNVTQMPLEANDQLHPDSKLTDYEQISQEPTEEYTDNQNITEEEYVENHVNEKDIQDFEKEQNEMFYSEGVDPVYLEESSEARPHAGEVQQDQGFNYYQGVQSEEFPVLNDNNEMTQRYDPQYQQQYVEPHATIPHDGEGDQFYDQASAENQGYDQTTAEHQFYDQTSAEHQVYDQITAEHNVYNQTSVENQDYDQTTAEHLVYDQTPAENQGYDQTVAEHQVYDQTVAQHQGYDQTPAEYPAGYEHVQPAYSGGYEENLKQSEYGQLDYAPQDYTTEYVEQSLDAPDGIKYQTEPQPVQSDSDDKENQQTPHVTT